MDMQIIYSLFIQYELNLADKMTLSCFAKLIIFLCFFLKYASFSPVCLIFLANKFANTIIFSTFAKNKPCYVFVYIRFPVFIIHVF